jgi:hypothetical protein
MINVPINISAIYEFIFKYNIYHTLTQKVSLNYTAYPRSTCLINFTLGNASQATYGSSHDRITFLGPKQVDVAP